MIPLRDNIAHQRTPLVVLILISLNVLTFAFQLSLELSDRPWRGEIFVQIGGIVPAALTDRSQRDVSMQELQGRVLDDLDHRYAYGFWIPRNEIRNWKNEERQVKEDFQWALTQSPFLGFLTLITSMFLHGGFFHLLGNVWFLWVFGNNVEDRLGHGRFLLFYILCGIAAGLAHWFVSQESLVPTIGASGAIGGVLGAYIVLFPHARVLTFIPLFIFLLLREIPAWIFLGIWFLFEWIGAQSIFFSENREVGGIAHWAHIGGFLAGFFLVRIFTKRYGSSRPSIHYTIR